MRFWRGGLGLGPWSRLGGIGGRVGGYGTSIPPRSIRLASFYFMRLALALGSFS